MGFWVKWGKKEEVLVRERDDLTIGVELADGKIEWALFLTNMDILHASTKEGGDIGIVRGRDDFSDSLSKDEHRIEVLVEESVDTFLAASDVDLFKEEFKLFRGSRIRAVSSDAAAESDNFVDTGIDQRDGLANSLIEFSFTFLKWDIAV